MTNKKKIVAPPKLRLPGGWQPKPPLQEHVKDAFLSRLKSQLNIFEQFKVEANWNENTSNPESVEGWLIQDSINTTTEAIGKAESSKKPSIHDLIQALEIAATNYGMLMYARGVRATIGKTEYTLKAALIDAGYHAEWGRHNREPRIQSGKKSWVKTGDDLSKEVRDIRIYKRFISLESKGKTKTDAYNQIVQEEKKLGLSTVRGIIKEQRLKKNC